MGNGFEILDDLKKANVNGAKYDLTDIFPAILGNQEA